MPRSSAHASRSETPSLALGIGLFGAGLVTGLAIQPFSPGGWWLDSEAGVRVGVTALFVAALATSAVIATVVDVRRPSLALSSSIAAAAGWSGSVVGVGLALLAKGPGTIFPVVLAVSGALSALPMAVGSLLGVAVGGALGTALRATLRHRTRL